MVSVCTCVVWAWRVELLCVFRCVCVCVCVRVHARARVRVHVHIRVCSQAGITWAKLLTSQHGRGYKRIKQTTAVFELEGCLHSGDLECVLACA